MTLISNKAGFLDTSSEDVTEEEIIDYLAKIIADIYLKEINKTLPKN